MHSAAVIKGAVVRASQGLYRIYPPLAPIAPAAPPRTLVANGLPARAALLRGLPGCTRAAERRSCSVAGCSA